MKLYTEDESGPQSTKKPVVMESYNEIVFPDPSEAFFARVQNHPAVIVPRLPAGFNLPNPGKFLVSMNFEPVFYIAFDFELPMLICAVLNENKRGDTKDHPLSQWFLNFSEADELLKLAAARQEVRIGFLIFLFNAESVINFLLRCTYNANILELAYSQLISPYPHFLIF